MPRCEDFISISFCGLARSSRGSIPGGVPVWATPLRDRFETVPLFNPEPMNQQEETEETEETEMGGQKLKEGRRGVNRERGRPTYADD